MSDAVSSAGSLLRTEGLVKIYNGRRVVNGVDINVKSGEIVGLLGPNGAGKTTTIHILAGFLQPDSGAVLQYSSLRAPSPRYRTYRFAETGAERTTARPREGEEALPPRRWSDVDVRQRRFTAEAPVLEISTLLYLLPASTLRAQGDHIDLLGYATSADALFDLDARAGEGLRLAVDYALQSDGSSTTRRRIIEALPVVLTGRPRSTDPDEQTFDLLGLRDVRFLSDPEDRVVAALRAQVPGAGQVQFQLVALELRDELPARCAPAGA